jgi:hypothetical protein
MLSATQPPPPLEPEFDENSIFLPVVFRIQSLQIFGAETHNFEEWKLAKANEANLSWLRHAAFSWADIEPVRTNPPTYHWEVVDEAGLIRAASHYVNLIATVKFTPTWAQEYSGYSCGPIEEDDLDEFYQFVYTLVARYSVPPFNIHYWEFGNEPDVDPYQTGFPPNQPHVFGCWGDGGDPYYGGRYYAEMLERAYPAVKAASPASKVLIGGLLLNCDPAVDPVSCKPAKFFEGILRNGGANYFDIVAFHSYATYFLNHIYDLDYPSWTNRGGQINGKIDFLKSVMNTFGVSKPIMLTEVSLQNCRDCEVTSHFLDLQADFVVSMFIRSWGKGLLGSIWYTLEDTDWRQTGLFYLSFEPKPGYDALVFMTKELNDARIGPQITQYPGLQGYQFALTSKDVWVLWSPDGVTGKQINVPVGVNKIFDKFGVPIEPIPSQITITHPTYFEIPH